MRTLLMAVGTDVHEYTLDQNNRLGAVTLQSSTRRWVEDFCRDFGPKVPDGGVLVLLRGAAFLLGVRMGQKNQQDACKAYVYPVAEKNDFRANSDFRAFVEGYRSQLGPNAAPLIGNSAETSWVVETSPTPKKPRDTLLTRIDEESYEDLVALGVAGARVAVEILAPGRVDLQRFANDLAASLPGPTWNRDGRASMATLWSWGEPAHNWAGSAPYFVSDGSFQAPFQADWDPPAVGRASHGIYVHADIDAMTEEEDNHLLHQNRYQNRALNLKWPACPRLFIGATQSLASRRKVFPFRWDAGVYVYLNREEDAIEIDAASNRQAIESLEAEMAANFPGRSFMSLKQQELGVEGGSALAARYMLALREVFGLDKAASAKRARRVLWGLK